jgi:hypothetical protein
MKFFQMWAHASEVELHRDAAGLASVLIEVRIAAPALP